MPTDNCSAIILAGGKSSRMGSPKALLSFGGEPLISYIVRLLGSLFTDIVVVAAPDQKLPDLPVTLAHDVVAHQGPVRGIYHGLDAASGAVGFVVSCDIAFINLNLIAHLLTQAAGFDAVVPVWDGRLQPLFAVYRKTVVPHLREQLDRNLLRPIFLYDRVRTRKVEEAEIRRFDPDGLSFFNMNSPADYQAALLRWKQEAATTELPGAESLSCTVEFFGTARFRAKTKALRLQLVKDATLADVYSALARSLPNLVGQVIAPQGTSLTSGHSCNINGLDFVRNSDHKIHPNDRILIVSADAGG